MLSQHDKVFIVIGFPKCGTSSLQIYFKDSGKIAYHNTIKGEYIGELIFNAKKKKKPLLSYIQKCDALTQIDCNASRTTLFYYPQLSDVPIIEQQYPNCKFILNVRNSIDWVKSISYWGKLKKNYIEHYLPAGVGKNNIHLISWYKRHKRHMMNYFRNKPEKLLIYDIDKDKVDKLNQFCGYDKVTKFPHLNQKHTHVKRRIKKSVFVY